MIIMKFPRDRKEVVVVYVPNTLDCSRFLLVFEMETYSVAQARLELTMWPRLASSL